jgi:hypothetical protein
MRGCDGRSSERGLTLARQLIDEGMGKPPGDSDGVDRGGLAASRSTPQHRARDSAEVRPEWGLVGCRVFVAAPRHRTASGRLDGRTFLHDYDWRADSGWLHLFALDDTGAMRWRYAGDLAWSEVAVAQQSEEVAAATA